MAESFGGAGDSGLDFDHISELFAAFGRVDVRTMFGGAGIYADGVMFGLVVDEFIYLKTDERSAARFEREGCGPFTYDTKRGESSLKSYWRMPDRLYDDPPRFFPHIHNLVEVKMHRLHDGRWNPDRRAVAPGRSVAADAPEADAGDPSDPGTARLPAPAQHHGPHRSPTRYRPSQHVTVPPGLFWDN